MYAARQGSDDAAIALLESGANIDAVSADRSSALLFATIERVIDPTAPHIQIQAQRLHDPPGLPRH